jgi:hypothetical protein
VRIVVVSTVVILNVCSQRSVADGTGFVVDLVFRVDQITTGQAEVLGISSAVGRLTLEARSLYGANA